MPVKLTKTPKGKVKVSTPGGVKSKGTSMKKAKAQERLLNAVEQGYGPTGNPMEPMMKPPMPMKPKMKMKKKMKRG